MWWPCAQQEGAFLLRDVHIRCSDLHCCLQAGVVIPLAVLLPRRIVTAAVHGHVPGSGCRAQLALEGGG